MTKNRRMAAVLACTMLCTCSKAQRTDMTIRNDQRPGVAQAILNEARVGCIDGLEYLVIDAGRSYAVLPHYKTPAADLYRCGESALYQREQKRQARLAKELNGG